MMCIVHRQTWMPSIGWSKWDKTQNLSLIKSFEHDYLLIVVEQDQPWMKAGHAGSHTNYQAKITAGF